MIIKRHHNRAFVSIANAVMDDTRLSAEHLGFLAYLLSRPHDWQVHVLQLAKRFKVGRNKTYRLLSELMDFGYIERGDQGRSGGRYAGIDYVVFDQPIPVSDIPRTQNEAAVNRVPESGTHTNKDSNQKELTNSSPSGESALPGFEEEKPKAKRKTGWPGAWEPDLAEAGRLLECALPRAKAIAEKFRDFHQARGSKFVDWDAAWRTWLRNEQDFAARSRPVEKPPSKDGFSIMKS